MIAKLRNAETAAADEPLVSEPFSREAIAEPAYSCALEQRNPTGRRLRNRIIIANAIAWVAITALIGLIFF